MSKNSRTIRTQVFITCDMFMPNYVFRYAVLYTELHYWPTTNDGSVSN